MVPESESKAKENSVSKVSQFSPNTLSRFIEFTSVLTLITASLYFIGYGYYDSFFGRLSLPHMGLNLPTIFYFQEMWRVWLLGIIIISSSFLWAKEPPITTVQVIFGNLTLIIIAIGGILWYLPMVFDKNNSYIGTYGVVSFVFVLFFLTVHASKHHWSLAHFFYSSGLIIRIILTGGFIFFMFWIAGIMGSFDATRLAAGDLPNSQEITLELKEPNNDLQNRSFILVLHYDDKYYLVEKSIPIPEYPLLYIIPDDQVKMAKVHRIQ